MRHIFVSLIIFSWINILSASAPSSNNKSVSITVTLEDIVRTHGTPSIELVEYSSLNCAACAIFHRDVYPMLEKEYIDTGKVRFIFRHFPLDEQAAKVAAVVSIASQTKQLTCIHRLFEQQANWINAPKPARKLSDITGVPEKACVAAMDNKQLIDAIFQKRLDAEKKYKIDGTPTFFINDKMFNEMPTLENFKKVLDLELSNSKSPKNNIKKV